MKKDQIKKGNVMGIPVAALGWGDVEERIIEAARKRKSATVYLFNVHSAVTQIGDIEFREALKQGTYVLPDGAPIAWVLRMQGFRKQPRIGGPDLMWRLCEAARMAEVSIALYGGEPSVVKDLASKLEERFPGLQIVEKISPPYRQLTQAEEKEMVGRLDESGAGLVFVALGCPKQEKWMARNVHRLDAVLIGVGAAFDFHAGKVSRAPVWMQRIGLEWLGRLMADPRRLWKRYLLTNTVFVLWALAAWPLWLYERLSKDVSHR